MTAKPGPLDERGQIPGQLEIDDVVLDHWVWARCAHELKPTMRFGPVPRDEAIACAEELGDQLGAFEGVRSVWVQRGDETVWAAGEKALDLAEQDIRLPRGGHRG